MNEFFGTPLIGEVYAPDSVRAVVVIAHGLGEHRGRYERAVAQFQAANIATVVYDQRGHGDSPGERTDIDRFSIFSGDLARIVEGVSREFSSMPIFLWGHSMGSLVVLDYVLRSHGKLAGCISSGCPIAKFPGPFIHLAGFLRKLAPKVKGPRISSHLDPILLTHDEAVMQDYRDDPEVIRSITWRLVCEIASASQRIVTRAHEIEIPWIFVHGSDDEIAPPEGSRRLHSRLGAKDKQLVVLDGLRHEVHNELPIAAAQFYDLTTNWIRKRSTAS